jgi:hypothetical protein
MLHRSSLASIALAAALCLTAAGARAFEDAKYPEWKGQWIRLPGAANQATWDPDKPWGLPQQAPLKPEFQEIFEANLKDQAAGGQGTDPAYLCLPHGMPRVMLSVQPMEIVVMPETTYVMHEIFSTLRRIYTDGRTWPAEIKPSPHGYSIGTWQDTDGDGRFDTLVVETRAIAGRRSFDNSGIPLHPDNKTIVHERISVDKSNPNVILNEVTTIDNALTRPWTVLRKYRRLPAKQPVWSEYICTEDNHHLELGGQNYVISGDGFLMPTKKNQPPPDLKYFE